jgi:hypothetical protein
MPGEALSATTERELAGPEGHRLAPDVELHGESGDVDRDTIWTTERRRRCGDTVCSVAAVSGDRGDHAGRGVHSANARIAPVTDVDVAGRIHRDPGRCIQIRITRGTAVATKTADAEAGDNGQVSGGVYLEDPVAPRRNERVAARVDGDCARHANRRRDRGHVVRTTARISVDTVLRFGDGSRQQKRDRNRGKWFGHLDAANRSADRAFVPPSREEHYS